VIRLLGHAGALVLGAAVGVASVAVHRDQVAGFPAGLVFVAVVSVCVAWALRLVFPAGRFAASYCLGWLVVLGYVVAGRPEGDFAIAGDLPGYGLLVVALVMVAAMVSSLVARDPARTTT
jgi:hypothetical protein